MRSGKHVEPGVPPFVQKLDHKPKDIHDRNRHIAPWQNRFSEFRNRDSGK